jgi:hypothetical protein
MKQNPKITEYVWSMNTIELWTNEYLQKIILSNSSNGIINDNPKIAIHAIQEFFDTLLKYEIDTYLHNNNARDQYNQLHKQRVKTQEELKENLEEKSDIQPKLQTINNDMKKQLLSIKQLIKNNSFYKETLIPYEKIINAQSEENDIKTLIQIPYFDNLYKILWTISQEKPDQNTLKKIFKIRSFIKWVEKNKKQKSTISILNQWVISSNDIEKYYNTLNVQEIKINKPIKRKNRWNWWKREIKEYKEPFKKSEVFIHLLRRLWVEEQHLFWKKIIIYFWNEFSYHATFFSFYLDEINWAKIDKTLFLFNPDVTTWEPNRSTYIFEWKIELEKLYEIEWSLKEFLTDKLNATVIKQTSDRIWWEKRVIDGLFEPSPKDLMQDTKILNKLYHSSHDYFAHFHKDSDGIVWKTKNEITHIIDEHYSGIQENENNEPYNMNFQRLSNAHTYAQEAHKINKFIRHVWRDWGLLSMDYIWFRNLLLKNQDSSSLTLHNNNIERYLIVWLHPCSDDELKSVIINKNQHPKITELFWKIKEHLVNPYLFKQRVTQFNRDENLVEQYWFLNESLAWFKKQYERVMWTMK